LFAWGFGSRVRPFETLGTGNTPLRTMVFGSERPPDPDAPLSAEIAANPSPANCLAAGPKRPRIQTQPKPPRNDFRGGFPSFNDPRR